MNSQSIKRPRYDRASFVLLTGLILACFAIHQNALGQCAPNALLQTLNNPGPTTSDFFGLSVAVSGNVAVVGADQDDPGGVLDAGTAYVFNTATGALLATLNNPAPSIADSFG